VRSGPTCSSVVLSEVKGGGLTNGSRPRNLGSFSYGSSAHGDTIGVCFADFEFRAGVERLRMSKWRPAQIRGSARVASNLRASRQCKGAFICTGQPLFVKGPWT
jgi:hypothetical protein